MKALLLALIAMTWLTAPAMAEHHAQAADMPHVIEADVVQVVVAPRAEAIRRIQAELAVRGFNPGPIDGVIGPRTMTAMRAFQRDEGMMEGLLTVETLERLGIGVRRPVYPGRGTETSLSGASGEPMPEQASPATEAPTEPVAAPTAPAVVARTALPNFVGRNGVVSETAPLDWPGRRVD
jgi:peptidoglycan hydrolase-like protein with peptidoglycan-binding domain